jgi:ribosomal protein L7/L12
VPGGGSRHTEAVPSDAEEIAQLKLEVARLGRLVEGLYVRLDGVAPDATVDVNSEPPADVVDALRVGNVIQAIKLWRGYTGLGLAEAKNEVEQLQARLGL